MHDEEASTDLFNDNRSSDVANRVVSIREEKESREYEVHHSPPFRILHATSKTQGRAQVDDSRGIRLPVGKQPSADDTYSVSVSPPGPTFNPTGISLAELQRLSCAIAVMSAQRERLAFLSVAAPCLDARRFRELLRAVEARVSDCQRRAGLTRLHRVTVVEGRNGDHAHLIVNANDRAFQAIGRLPTSERFRQFDKYGYSAIDVKRVYDVNQLQSYLSKEATSFAHKSAGKTFRREFGHHALKLGGDRVRVGKHLKADMERAGLWQPYRQTYAVRMAQA